MIFLYTIIIFLIDSGLTFDNETLALNATIIDNIMRSKITVNTSQLNESKYMNYLYGDPEINDYDRQLDTSVFDPEEVKLIYETATAKGDLMARKLNISRRWYYTPGFRQDETDNYIDQSMDFMRQSIYGTRYRLKDTKYIRKFFANDLGYQLAILYGSLMQLRIKMDNLYASLYKFDREIKFLWHIVLYERCLAATVDANNIVERMFELANNNRKDMDLDMDYTIIENPNRGKIKPQFPPP